LALFEIQPGDFPNLMPTGLHLPKIMEAAVTFDLSKPKLMQLQIWGSFEFPWHCHSSARITGNCNGSILQHASMFLGVPRQYYFFWLGYIALTLLTLGISNNIYLAVGIGVIIQTALIMMG